jgi:predicted metal-dependent phosphoesterase TrpH
MREFRADLHVHTCLSPCGELDLSPAGIVEKATESGLDIIGICDHNSAENVPALMQAASGSGLAVIAGMEVTTKEEVHMVALFDRVEGAFALQAKVYENLPGSNDEEAFGMQVQVNAAGEVLGFNNRLLIGATTIGIDEVVERIRRYGGLAIAAHIDREGFGIIGQLGFIPPDLKLDALEVSYRVPLAEAKARFPEYAQYAMVQSSDAHSVTEIGRGSTVLALKEPTLAELKLAFAGRGGRRVVLA